MLLSAISLLVVVVAFSTDDMKGASASSWSELESKIGAIPDGGQGSFALTASFSMQGYEGGTAGIEIPEGITVTITGKGTIFDAHQDPTSPGGRLFAVHGKLIVSGVEMKNAVGVNACGALYIPGGSIDLTGCTFTGCYGGADDVTGGGAFGGGGVGSVFRLKDCKFTAKQPRSTCTHHADPGCADGVSVSSNMTFQRTCPGGSVKEVILWV
jgi:hypothetical protein